MSLELPEAYILAEQMSRELPGKEISDYILQNHAKLQKLGFVNRDSSAFNKLRGGRINSVVSRGNVIQVKTDNGMNLILAPEYGGTILYYTKNSTVPEKFHLKLLFTDDSKLTVTLSGMGVIQAFKDEELEQSYVYRRDFSSTTSPLDPVEFTFERFSKQLADKTVNIKSVLVGKDAVIVGLSNSAFQDILFRARVHPKRKASSLADSEKRALYEGIKSLIHERISSGGKDQFTDLHGKQGNYISKMGPVMRDKPCKTCGRKVEQLSLGGGQVFFCPNCQQ